MTVALLPRCLTRVILIATFLLATPSLSLAAPSDQWAEQFTMSFTAQVVNVLDGTLTPPPASDGAALRTVAGLNVGDPIVVDGSDGAPHQATVVAVNPNTHWVTWSPSFGTGVTAALNQFVSSPYGLSYPKQSAIDALGRIYTIDTSNNRIVVYKDNGQVLWTLGGLGRVYSNAALGLAADDGLGPCAPACPNNPGALIGKFLEPHGIDVSPDGNTLVVGDSGNHRVQVFQQNPAGVIGAVAARVAGPRFDAYAVGAFGTAAGRFNTPMGVSLNASGRIAVADSGNNRILVFTPSAAGTIVGSDGAHKFTALAFGQFGQAQAGQGGIQFVGPEDVEFDRSATVTGGRIVVADTQNHRIQVFSGSGAFISAIQTDVAPSPAPGDFDAPAGVAVDEAGRIYVADTGHSRIQIFTPSANGASYALADPVRDVFGAEQVSGGVPGEISLLGPTGVAIGSGRLLVTEIDGQRVKVLTRADVGIDVPVSVSRTSLTVQDPAQDTVHVIVRVRNTGGVDLTNVSLAASTTAPGVFSAVLPAAVDLARAGASTDTANFEFDFRVTGLDSVGTLRLSLSATGNAGPVIVHATQNVDTQVTIAPPSFPAIALGSIAVTPTRAGLNQHITVTVPVQNIGGQTLSNVRITATPTAASLVTPVTDSVLIASLPSHMTQPATFDFTALAIGFVRFDITVTAEDVSHHPVPSEPLRAMAPVAPGVEIVRDNLAPTLSLTVTPAPNPVSADGKAWYNGAATPCAAATCPRPAVPTWPTIHLSASDEQGGSGIQRIGWRMVDTSNQPQSDQAGSCSGASGSIWPSACSAGPNGTLLWDRTLTAMQKRIILAFWAQDQAGNGAATTDEELACLAQGTVAGITRVNRVTCLTLFVDVELPILVQGAITLNNDNTEARIAFTGGDPISQVSGMSTPDAQLLSQGTNRELVIRSEGTSVAAHVTVTDFARNSATMMLPFTGSDLPAIRLDHTPPNAFNRIDPAALGKRCTTMIAGQPVTFFCTNKVYGTDNLPGLTTAAFAPVQVTATRWGSSFDSDRHEEWDGRREDNDRHRAHREVSDRGHEGDEDEDDHDHDGDDDDDDGDDWVGEPAELHTYTFSDAFIPSSGLAPIQNPNQVTLVEKVRQSGSEARVRVMSYRYQQGSVAGAVIIPNWAYKKYQWTRNSDGSLKSLIQMFEIYKGRYRVKVLATFDARTNTTTVNRTGQGATRAVAQGLILLRLTTSQERLKIEYDLNAPVPLPDLAPPVIALPASLSAEATSADGAPVTFTSSANDAVDGVVPVICTALSGSTFALGTTTVGCSAADAAGNIAQRTMAVTVRDTTRPVLTLPATITLTTSSSSGANVSYAASAVDVVSGNRPVQCSPTSGSKFKVGTTTVSCSASDAAGNTATGSFAIVVKKN